VCIGKNQNIYWSNKFLLPSTLITASVTYHICYLSDLPLVMTSAVEGINENMCKCVFTAQMHSTYFLFHSWNKTLQYNPTAIHIRCHLRQFRCKNPPANQQTASQTMKDRRYSHIHCRTSGGVEEAYHTSDQCQ